MLVGDDHGIKIPGSHPDPSQTSLNFPGAQTGIDEDSNPRGSNVDAVPFGAAGEYRELYAHVAQPGDTQTMQATGPCGRSRPHCESYHRALCGGPNRYDTP